MLNRLGEYALPSTGRALLLVAVAMLVFAQQPVYLLTQGVLDRQSTAINVEALADGEITIDHVRSGDLVSAGDLLLEQQAKPTDRAASLRRQAEITARLIRLHAEKENIEPVFPSKLSNRYPQMVSAERELLRERHRQLASALAPLQAREDNLQKQLLKLRPQLRERKVSREQILAIETEISALKIKAEQLKNDFKERAVHTIVQQQRQLNWLEGALAEQSDTARVTRYRAPLSGRIISVVAAGESVLSGDTVARLLPENYRPNYRLVLPQGFIKFGDSGTAEIHVKTGQRPIVVDLWQRPDSEPADADTEIWFFTAPDSLEAEPLLDTIVIRGSTQALSRLLFSP